MPTPPPPIIINRTSGNCSSNSVLEIELCKTLPTTKSQHECLLEIQKKCETIDFYGGVAVLVTLVLGVLFCVWLSRI